jgi:two-component system sensor histidine kinase CpxA
MKVSLPLSLKVAIWLLLNLLLLGAAAVAFLVAQGGLSWDSLVAGGAGDRLHALANVASGEVAAAALEDRDAVLARFGAVYDADFLIVRNHGAQIAGAAVPLPRLVRDRIDEGPPSEGPPARARPRPAPPGDMGPDDPPEDRPRAEAAYAPPQPNGARRAGGRLGRFVMHAGTPPTWWVGFRVPFSDDGENPVPATLVIRAHSFRALIRLLSLETWFLVGAAVFVFSILFWLPLVRSITRRLRALTTATEKIAEGKFETRVSTGSSDELGRLGESVNTMASRLDNLVNGQKRFLGDVAHELGSPLGRLQVATEILESRADASLREHVSDVREEVQHMAELVNELLAFTKAGMRPRDATLMPVSIDGIFAKVLVREDPDRRVPRPADSGLVALADEPLLTRSVGNLVRNALRYAGDNARIALHARRTGDQIVITVDDDGPGVPAAALERLGEPFYRPELARTRESGGVGLGLAIVRSGVTACGGEVKFSNRSPRGFRAEISLAAAARVES